MKIKTIRRFFVMVLFTAVCALTTVATLPQNKVYAASASVTEMGDHGGGIAKFVLGNWNNYDLSAGNPAGYSLELEKKAEIEPYILVNGVTIPVFEEANPSINLSINRAINWITINVLQGFMEEGTEVTLKAGMPLPHHGDASNIVLSGDTLDKDYTLVIEGGIWTVSSEELKVLPHGELSDSVVNGDYTDVTFNINFNHAITDNNISNLTGNANNNIRSKIYFDGKLLNHADRTTDTPSAGEISVPNISANGKILTLTLRRLTAGQDDSMFERKELRIENNMTMPNNSVYSEGTLSRWYIAEIGYWIHSEREKPEIVSDNANQLFLNTIDPNNYQLTVDGLYRMMTVRFTGGNSVLPSEGEQSVVKYNDLPLRLYGGAIANNERTEESIDKALGEGYYKSLLDNVKVNGHALGSSQWLGKNDIRVDYYPDHLLFWFVDGIFKPSENELRVSFESGLFFPSGKNMNGRRFDIICLPGQKAFTSIDVAGVIVEGGEDTVEASEQNPVDIAVNQTYTVNGNTIPLDASVDILLYNIEKQSETGVIKLSKKGVVTGLKQGTATICVSALGGEGPDTIKYITFNVDHVEITGLSLTKTSETIFVGSTITLEPVFQPSNTSYKDISYLSNNTSVATVKDGIISAIGGGTAVITLTSVRDNTIKAEFTITVSKRPVSVSASPPKKRRYNLGDDLDLSGLSVSVTYDDGSVSNVPISIVTVAGYSKNTVGEQIINVIYEGSFDSFLVIVSDNASSEKSGCGGKMLGFMFMFPLLLAPILFMRKKKMIKHKSDA